MPVLYEDTRITCDADGVTVRFYYFPVGDKRIPYASIKAARELDMGTGIGGGRWRIWGSGDLRHWFHLDETRPKKRRALVLDLGGWVRPVLTPDDVDAFEKALKSNGVAVSAS